MRITGLCTGRAPPHNAKMAPTSHCLEQIQIFKIREISKIRMATDLELLISGPTNMHEVRAHVATKAVYLHLPVFAAVALACPSRRKMRGRLKQSAPRQSSAMS